MEFGRFNEFENAVQQRQGELADASVKANQERQRQAEKERNLELARERLRQKCRNAAEYLISKNIPTTRGKITVGLNGGSAGMGNYVKPTKFKEVVFPEGWVISKSSHGEACGVLTTDGIWLMVVTNNSALGKIGDIVEFPYHRHDNYGIDSEGPYLRSAGDPYGEYPPGNREEEFTRMVATVITG